MGVYSALLVILGGILLLMWGAMMPETVETTVRSCYTGAWGVQQCTNAVATERNNFRVVTIVVGFVASIAGIFLMDEK